MYLGTGGQIYYTSQDDYHCAQCGVELDDRADDGYCNDCWLKRERDKMITITEAMERDGIRILRVRKASPAANADANWEADWWQVTLTDKHGRTVSTKYGMGSGYNGEKPDAASVFSCLVSDAQGYECAGRTFKSWAEDYGYSDDSIAALKIFNAVKRAAVKLAEFLGASYSEYIFETENDL